MWGNLQSFICGFEVGGAINEETLNWCGVFQ